MLEEYQIWTNRDQSQMAVSHSLSKEGKYSCTGVSEQEGEVWLGRKPMLVNEGDFICCE